MTAQKGPTKRITVIESEQPLEKIQEAMSQEQLEEIEIVVRRPDKSDSGPIHTASLCSCRRICVAIIDQ